MNTMKLSKMEEILKIPKETECVTINQDAVLYFLYVNNSLVSQKSNIGINVKEVRKRYINMISQMYTEKTNNNEMVFNYEDIKKIKTLS